MAAENISVWEFVDDGALCPFCCLHFRNISTNCVDVHSTFLHVKVCVECERIVLSSNQIIEKLWIVTCTPFNQAFSRWTRVCQLPPLCRHWFSSTLSERTFVKGSTKSRPEPSGRCPEPSGRNLDHSSVEWVPDQHETCYNVVAMWCYILQFIVV